MSALSLNVQQKFTNLRKKLDQLGYMQPLSLDSLPLVESLFTDFVWTTESFRKCKSELDKRVEVRERVEDYVEPYKADNARLLSEHNRVQKRLLEMRVANEETVQDLQAQIRQLEQQKYDLVLFNQQCLDKIGKYESEAKQMVQKIMQLQEKNFQAVVHTPEGKRKQIPFRRQRMDIDFFIPENTQNSNEYCCAVAKERAVNGSHQSNSSSDPVDLLEAITNKCKELSHQLTRAEEELELSDRKINSYCDKLKMYEDEISRLTRELSGGRSLEAVSSDGNQRARDRLVDQLNMQMDLLQQRNEELEQEVLRLNAINIKEGKISGIRSGQDNDGMMEIQNRKLRARIDELVDREKSLLKELHSANNKLSHQKRTECHPSMEGTLDNEVDNLHRHIRSLEDNLNYWRQEAENRGCVSSNTPSKDGEDTRQIREELLHCRHEMKAIVCQNNELRQMLNIAERNNTPPLIDKDRSMDLETELKKSRAERDCLQNLLDKFERQLHDIQGNIRVLTQERDMINERYEECKKELHELRQSIIKSDKPRKDCAGNTSLAAQSLLRRLELERDGALSDLHRMSTERDSLRERLKTVTETALSEKARLCQRLEDCENQKDRICQEKEEMVEKMSIIRNKMGELEEYNHQLIKRNDSLTGSIDNDRLRIQNMAADIQRFENDMQMKTRKEAQMLEELNGAEERLLTLQQRCDSQNVELTSLKNELVRLKEILKDVDQEKDQMQIEVDCKSEQLRDIQCQLKIKEDALDEVRVNISSLEQQLRRIQDLNVHRDKELRALVMHNEQLENDLRHEVSKCDQLKAENGRLEEDLMAVTRDQHRLEAEYRDCKRCIMETCQEKDQLEQRLNHCQSSESQQQKQNDELMDQYRHLSLDNDKLQLAVQRVDGINDQLKTEVDAREKIVRNMREQLLQAEADLDGLQCNVRHLEEQVSSLRHVLDSSAQVTENHAAEKQELIQELAAMRDFCARLENGKDNAQRQLSSRLLEQEQLKAENADLARENENLHEEIQSLQESIRSLETVMSAGREKEFTNQMGFQQRIAELETQNEELVHLQSKVQQMQRDLIKCSARNNELEAECERLRRQLTSEKFKLEYANQELLRRQRVPPPGYDTCDRSEGRPNDTEYYSSNFSPSEIQHPITPTGFCTDYSTDFLSRYSDCELVCNHGCYHSQNCNEISPGQKHRDKCGHGCHHSEECLTRKEKMRNDESRHRTRRCTRKLLDQLNQRSLNNFNSNNHVTHSHPQCPYNIQERNNQNDVAKSSAIYQEFKHEKLSTILSESRSIDADNNSSSTRSVSTSSSSNKEVNGIVSKIVYPNFKGRKIDVKEQGSKTFNKEENVHDSIVVPIEEINSGGIVMEKKQPRSLMNTDPIQHGTPVFTNDTVLSALSHMTQSTKNMQASSTLAQIPSLSSGNGPNHSQDISNKDSVNMHTDNERVHGTTPSLHMVSDEDPTDVSQSLSHSFYGITDGSQANNANSSSGVHTGRSFANHSPTITSTDNHVTTAPVNCEAVLPVAGETLVGGDNDTSGGSHGGSHGGDDDDESTL